MDYLVDVEEQGVTGLKLEVLPDELDDPTDLLLTVHLNNGRDLQHDDHYKIGSPCNSSAS